MAAAKLGVATWLVGAVGCDESGSRSLEELARRGVRVGFIEQRAGPTGVAQITVDTTGSNQITVAPGVNAELDPKVVSSSIERVPVKFAVVVASLEVPLEAVESAAEAASARGFKFVLNPAPAMALPARLVQLCFAITPNEHESLLLGRGHTEGDVVKDLLRTGAKSLVVTRGSRGADMYGRWRTSHQQAIEAAVVDTTGAGDAFNAAFAVALSRGRSLREAVRWGVVAGSVACEGIGAQGSLADQTILSTRLRDVINHRPSDTRRTLADSGSRGGTGLDGS